MTDIITKLEGMRVSNDVNWNIIREAIAVIEELRMDAEEHDRLFDARRETDDKLFAELRKDLGLPPSRLKPLEGTDDGKSD